VSSDIGKEKEYSNLSLVGGAAFITLGLWSSKVCHMESDHSGHDTYTITTLQGKKDKKISFISAYISVKKGSDIGIDSLYA
jgi:hypothetical protein